MLSHTSPYCWLIQLYSVLQTRVWNRPSPNPNLQCWQTIEKCIFKKFCLHNFVIHICLQLPQFILFIINGCIHMHYPLSFMNFNHCRRSNSWIGIWSCVWEKCDSYQIFSPPFGPNLTDSCSKIIVFESIYFLCSSKNHLIVLPAQEKHSS